MANQQNSYTGSQGTGTNSADFSFTFPSFTTGEVKVEVDNVVKTLTTHYTVENYNTTSGGTVRFTTNNIPTGTTPVRIFRQTDVDSPKATFTAGASLKAAEINDNFKQVRHALQEAIGANATDRQVQSFNIEDSAITTAKIKADNITNALIADDQIDSEHYVDGSIDTAHIGNAQVTTAKIADSNVTTAKIADNNITTGKILNSAVTTAKIADLNVTRGKLVNDAVNEDKLADLAVREEHIANSSVTSNKIANNAVTTTEILNGAVTRAKLEADAIDGTKLADNAVDSEHYTDGSIDADHIATGAITTPKIADNDVTTLKLSNDAVTAPKLAANAVVTTSIVDANVTTAKIADDAVTDAKIATGTLDNRYFTETELTNGALDGRYFTETESDARYFNISTGDTIKDGDTFPDNDTTIATTAAINDRIIDLVDDVGGFVPIANETSFPTANPDVNNGAGTLVSIKAIGSTRTPSGGTVTIANGAGTGNTVTITGCGSTVLTAGFGVIVETTTTLHTYAFHRLVPKATEVTTVAGISSNITTVANNTSNINAVAADASDIGTVAGSITNVNNVGNSIANVNTTAGSIANVNTTATNIANVNNVGNNISNVNAVHNNASNINSAVSNASNINSAVSNASNINTVAGSISNVNTTAGSISNVNTVASNINSVNSFFNTYRIGSSNPTSSLDTGDLFFNTTSNSLKVYTGSAWVDGVTATGNFAVVTGNTFTGSNNHNDNVKSIYGTGSDLELYHDGTNSFIKDTGTGGLKICASFLGINNAANNEAMIVATENGSADLYYNGSKKFETLSDGVSIPNDNDKLKIGASQDLYLWHNGSTGNSNITNVTGDLFIQGNNGSGTAVNQIAVKSNAAVELNYQGTKKLETYASGVAVMDNVKYAAGNSADLEIFHDGTNSFIKNTTGTLNIQGDSLRLTDSGLAHVYVKGISGGATELYYDNSKKFETTSTGGTLTGRLFADGLTLGDDEQIYLGANNDFQLFHSASAGENIIQGGYTALRIKDTAGRTSGYFSGGGQVELYHNNVKKLETNSDGIQVDGTATNLTIRNGTVSASAGGLITFKNVDGNGAPRDVVRIKGFTGGSTGGYGELTLQTAFANTLNDCLVIKKTKDVQLPNDNQKLQIGAGQDIELYTDGSNSFLNNENANWYIQGSSGSNNQEILIRPKQGEQSIRAIADGAVELYYDNSKKLETTSSGIAVTGSVEPTGHLKLGDNSFVYFGAGVSTDLYIGHEPNSSRHLFRSGDGATKMLFAGGAETMMVLQPQGAVELYNDNSKKFETTSGGAAVTGELDVSGTIDMNTDTGRLKIGAGDDLQLYHDGTNSYILNNGGQLRIQPKTGEYSIICYPDAAVELYHNNVLNVKTNTNGVYISTDADQGRIRLADTSGNIAYQITGQDVAASGESGGRMLIQDANGGTVVDSRTSGGNMFLYNTIKLNGNGSADNLKLIQGAGEDLQMYHDGSNSYLTNSTGALYIKNTSNSNLDIFSHGSSRIRVNAGELAVDCSHNSSVDLYYDNARKFSTTSTGGILPGNTDLRFENGNWTGDYSCKIQHHSNRLYIQGGSQGHRFRRHTGTDAWVIDGDGHYYPGTNNTYDIGTTSYRVRNIYTNDLHLSNEGSSNDVDGTWGDWTIQEGESDLFLKNNRSGKKFKFNLTEVS